MPRAKIFSKITILKRVSGAIKYNSGSVKGLSVETVVRDGNCHILPQIPLLLLINNLHGDYNTIPLLSPLSYQDAYLNFRIWMKQNLLFEQKKTKL